MNDRPDAIMTALRTAVDVHNMLAETPTSSTEVDAAGKALIRAGIALLFRDQGPVVVLPLTLAREVYCTLKNGEGALDLTLENLSATDHAGVSAVVDLTRTALALEADKIDEVVLRRAGWVFAEDA